MKVRREGPPTIVTICDRRKKDEGAKQVKFALELNRRTDEISYHATYVRVK